MSTATMPFTAPQGEMQRLLPGIASLAMGSMLSSPWLGNPIPRDLPTSRPCLAKNVVTLTSLCMGRRPPTSIIPCPGGGGGPTRAAKIKHSRHAVLSRNNSHQYRSKHFPFKHSDYMRTWTFPKHLKRLRNQAIIAQENAEG